MLPKNIVLLGNLIFFSSAKLFVSCTTHIKVFHLLAYRLKLVLFLTISIYVSTKYDYINIYSHGWEEISSFLFKVTSWHKFDHDKITVRFKNNKSLSSTIVRSSRLATTLHWHRMRFRMFYLHGVALNFWWFSSYRASCRNGTTPGVRVNSLFLLGLG